MNYLLIDNYDSFSHNLARYFTCAGVLIDIRRNDALGINDIVHHAPDAIILSPGPCTPHEAGICMDVIRHLGETIPILGVCLGHQAIGEVFGAPARTTNRLAHGKSAMITHDGQDLFKDLPSPLQVGRYHSLIIEPQNTRDGPLLTTAQTRDGLCMAVKHKTAPIYGVQFHPESILTPQGAQIVYNFTKIVQEFHDQGSIAA